MLVDGFTAEGVVLKVEEASGTLNICHAFGRRVLQAGECFAAGKRPLELTDELVEMVLYHTIEIDELSVDIVEYLYFCRNRAHKEQCCAPGKQLNITRMLGEHG
ncbi:hypothetical protein HMPREF2872_01430 [Neisseria sp. HMSC069H12]|nr:hypothetical protein HMPREF2872_01430 [Neisseria sp. HMSC069H12]